MTDLRHVAQLLHEAGVSEGLGPTAMASWLGRRINERRTRRRERGTGAPSRIGRRGGAGDHDPPEQGARVPDRALPLHVGQLHRRRSRCRCSTTRTTGTCAPSTSGSEGNGFAVHQQNQLVEERGEDLRLLYVALTRAQHQAVLWWVGANDCQHSPLSRLLFDRDEHGVVRSHGTRSPQRDRRRGGVRRTGARPLGRARRLVPPDVRWHRDERRTSGARGRRLRSSARPRLAPRVVLGHHARRSTSSRRSGASRRSSSPRTRRCRAASGPRAAGAGRRRSPCGPSRWGWPPCPAGRWSARSCTACWSGPSSTPPTFRRGPRGARAARSTWRNVDLGSLDAVVAGLCAAIESPLGPMVDDVRLRDIPRRDRLDELGFEIPLGRGRRPRGFAARRPGGRSARRAPRPRTIRWPATPAGCGTRRSTASCAAI